MNVNKYTDYFNWLCEQVDEKGGDTSYHRLLENLFTINAFAILEDDRNRLLDGIALREEFGLLITSGPDSRCSMLELLIGISYRMDYISDSDGVSDNHTRWFWEMMANAELDGITDDLYEEAHKDYIYNTCMRFLHKDYGRYASKSFLPIREKTYRDYRKLSIRILMNDYLKSEGAVEIE